MDGVSVPVREVPAGVPLADGVFAVTANCITQSIHRQLLESESVSRAQLESAIAFCSDLVAPRWTLIRLIL